MHALNIFIRLQTVEAQTPFEAAVTQLQVEGTTHAQVEGTTHAQFI